MPERLLVIAPHCDDAELGCAGYIARTIEQGGEVCTVVATLSDQHFIHLDRIVTVAERTNELADACDVLGVSEFLILVPGYEARLHLYDMGLFVQHLDRLMLMWKPSIVMLPLPSSHQDHRYVHDAAVAACRSTPKKNHIKLVATYEYPSINWGPGGSASPSNGGMYVDITKYLGVKKQALTCYRTQMRGDNESLSLTGSEALARLRGVESGFEFAELFRVLRWRVV